MEGVAELRAKLAAEEKRHEDTKRELRQLQEQNNKQSDRIRELEGIVVAQRSEIATLRFEIATFKNQLASQEQKTGELEEKMGELRTRHDGEMAKVLKEFAAFQAQCDSAVKRLQSTRQKERYMFVAGQVATVFVERLG